MNATLDTMTLTADELLDIIVALDNETVRCRGTNDQQWSEKLPNLKWKVFALMVKAQKEAAANGNS